MKAQDLKNSVLQLAIQGKLVEQRKDERTAEELYKQIQEEKKKLIKEGKIKKEKPIPEIKDKEIPFDIPENWKWVRLGNILSVNGGKRIPAGRSLTDENTGYKYIRVADMKNGSVLLDNIKYIPIDIYPKIRNYTISKDNLYITVAGTIGQVGIVPDELDNANLTENADKLAVYLNNKKFIYYMLNSNCIQYQIKQCTTKVGQPKLAIKRIQELIFPLPPLKEQKRIVEKIEELIPMIDQYDKAYCEVELLNKKFPDDMQKSILQYAIQGKLVEQKKEEGTAEDLYKLIQEKKKKLIKQGKIKNEKPLPEIKDEEIPYDIPECWKWIRLGDCVSNKSGVSYKKENLSVVTDNMIRLLRGGNIADIEYSLKQDDIMIASQFVKEDLLLKKNILITPAVTSLQHIGKMARIEKDLENTTIGGFVLMLIPHIDEDFFSQYLLFALSSPYHRSICRTITNKSGQAFYNLSRDKLMNILVPIPPLEEQRRIVLKLEEIFPLCKNMILGENYGNS